MPSESGLAAAGSPQAFHFIGGSRRRRRSCVTVLQMLSISNAPRCQDRILAAAASCVVAFGVERVTLAEIARRAGVSRPTVYRRWPDTRSMLAALLTSRITDALDDVPVRGSGRDRPGRPGGRGGRAAAWRRAGHGGAALGVGAGLHRRAAGHQPADADRRAGRRPAGGPARRQRARRRSPPDWPRWCC